MALFLQGPKGVGKTTLLFKVLGSSGLTAGGFVVKRVYRRGQRVALDMVDLLTLKRDRLAYFDHDGVRTVNANVFTEVGIPAITRAVRSADLVVLDELGRFELRVPTFMDAVMSALDESIPVVGVLKNESNEFLDKVRARPDVQVVMMSPDSREKSAQEYRRMFRDLVKT